MGIPNPISVLESFMRFEDDSYSLLSLLPTSPFCPSV